MEHDYQLEVAAANRPQLRLGIVVSIVLWLAGAALIPAVLGVHDEVVVAICVAMAVANLLGFIATRWAQRLDRQQVVGLVLNGLAGLAVLALAEIIGGTGSLVAPAILLIAIFAFVVIRLRFVLALVAAATYLIGFGVTVNRDASPGAWLELFLVAAAIVVGTGATYLLERGSREVYAQRRTIEAQAADLTAAHATARRLLLNIIPEPIADRLESGETTIADWFDDATVLFADIVGFTQLASRLGPQATAELLDRLFSAFDDKASDRGLEKIKTIGDAYMAVGGVPEPSTDHPARAVALGLDLLDVTASIASELGFPLDLRIGIHTGPVVAGVIGTQKFSYDLWGDTVNVASRLESHGVAGSVQISEATWLRCQSTVAATPRGTIELKGHGAMPTWLVARRAPAS
jgi:adenylate cyclase